MNESMISQNGIIKELRDKIRKLESSNAELIEFIDSINDWWISARVENSLHINWKSSHNFDYPEVVLGKSMSYTQECAALMRMQNNEKEVARLRKVNTTLRAKFKSRNHR